MQYILYVGILLLIFIGYLIVIAIKGTKSGMAIYHRCENRYQELSSQGVGHREALIKICKEQYPHLSDNVHNKMVDKCHNVFQLSCIFSTVLENPRPKSWGRSGPLSDQEAIALIDSTIVSERGQIKTDYYMATNLLKRNET